MLFALLLPSAFAQEGFDAHGFHAAALDGDVRDPLQVNRPAGIDQGDWHLGGLVEYADSPLVSTTTAPDGTVTSDPVLDNLLALNLSTGFAVLDWLRLDLAAPIYLTSAGPGGVAQGAGIGDLRLSAVVAPIQPGDDRKFGLGVVPYLDLPTGDTAEFLGQSGLSGGISAIASTELGALTLSGELGAMFQPEIALDNLEGSDALNVGGGVGYAFSDRFGATLEARALVPFAANEVQGTAMPAEALLSGRYQTAKGGFFTLGGATAISGGAGAAKWRVFLGGGFGRVDAPVVILDTDGDGFLDNVDTCITEPETVNTFKDSDGCPDAVPNLSVRVIRGGGKEVKNANLALTIDGSTEQITTSGEGPVTRAVLPGKAVTAKATAGSCWAGEAATTGAETDGSLDVVLKRKEAKVEIEVVNGKGDPINNAEVRWERDGSGCLPEKDGPLGASKSTVDAGIGKHTMFVTAPEYSMEQATVELTEGETEKVKIVLKTTKVKVEAKQIAILEVVYFEVDKDIIKPESFALLDEVANVIRANPQAGRIEVAGHTDSDGDDAHNLDLSQRRSEAVRKYLMDKGVAGERLIAKGYGETKPLVPNKSTKNKAKNRRVEFNLIDAQAPGTPPGAIETTPR